MRLCNLLLLLLVATCSCLDNGLARTPPMGWMSWTAFYCEVDCAKHPDGCINEQLYMQMADHLVSDGYALAGYRSVHIDDCWSEMERDSNGNLVANKTRFPSGMKNLAKYMHDRNLHFGIYEDYGTKTCAGYPGTYQHERADAQIFAQWDVDYLKLDGCNIEESLMPVGYPLVERELNATGRPIIYSCSWPAYLINRPDLVDYNVIGKSCNTWRNFDDINSSWKSIISIISYYDKNQDKHIPTHGPGKWHDPDMLVIGNKGITLDMAISQMTIWCIWSAPLIMSNDLRTIQPQFKAVLQNYQAIKVNQDPFGIMGRLIKNTTDIATYVKQISPSNGDKKSFAFALLNRNETKAYKHVEIRLDSIGLQDPAGYFIHDVWSGEDLGILRPADSILASLNPAGSVFYTAHVASLRRPFPKIKYPFSNRNVLYDFERSIIANDIGLYDYLKKNRVQSNQF